jgi:hypothetical protein
VIGSTLEVVAIDSLQLFGSYDTIRAARQAGPA